MTRVGVGAESQRQTHAFARQTGELGEALRLLGGRERREARMTLAHAFEQCIASGREQRGCGTAAPLETSRGANVLHELAPLERRLASQRAEASQLWNSSPR